MWTAFEFNWGEFVPAKLPPPAQAGRMTRKKLETLIRAGYGQGHFQRYKPWLRVTKRDMSPVSIVGHLPSPQLARLHHFRSMAERRTIQLAWWLGAHDVREQYPMWPWPHSHPAVGLPGVEEAERIRGLVDIADEAFIRHGTFVGQNIPYVGTIDILTTWQQGDGGFLLIGLDNKPQAIAEENVIQSRAKERLELARRYCSECNIPHLLLHAEKFSHELLVNIDALAPTIRLPRLDSPAYLEVVKSIQDNGYYNSPTSIINSIASKRDYSPNELYAHFRLALWRLDIDHDLTQPLNLENPLKTGGIYTREKIRKVWLGEKA